MTDPTPEQEVPPIPGLDRWPDLVLTVLGAVLGWFARHYTQGKQ